MPSRKDGDMVLRTVAPGGSVGVRLQEGWMFVFLQAGPYAGSLWLWQVLSHILPRPQPHSGHRPLRVGDPVSLRKSKRTSKQRCCLG